MKTPHIFEALWDPLGGSDVHVPWYGSKVRRLQDHLLWFLMRNRPEYWCSFWLTPFEWVFANRNFYHFWHHDFTSLLLHLLYTLTWVTHFIFHNKIPVESSHELLKSNHQKLQHQSQKYTYFIYSVESSPIIFFEIL